METDFFGTGDERGRGISANGSGATDARLTAPASFLNDGVSARSAEKKKRKKRNDRWLDAHSLV